MISAIFSLLGLLLLLASIVALIKPSWVKAPKNSRILGFLAYLTAAILMGSGATAFMTPEQKAEQEARTAAYEAKQVAEEAEKQKAYEASELKKTKDELEKAKAEAEKAKQDAELAKQEAEKAKLSTTTTPVAAPVEPAPAKTDAEKLADLQAALRKKAEELKAEGVWEVEEDVSKVDDSKNVWLLVKSNRPVAGRYNRKAWGRLVLRCMENKTDVLITFDQYLSTMDIQMLTRLDKEKASTRKWNITTDHEGLMHPDPVGFIRQLEKHDALYVQFTPYSSEPVEIEFNLRGLDKSVNKLKEPCGWK